VSSKKISFDLLNEPSRREDMNDQHSRATPVPGTSTGTVAKHCRRDAIRKENPQHLVIADGNNVGTGSYRRSWTLDIAQSAGVIIPCDLAL